MSTQWQREWIKIPKRFTPDERLAIGHDIVELIRKRTEAGKDRTGSAFPGYSEAYKQSLDFKNAGKSGKVDLTLSGDMLTALDVLSDKPGAVMVGFENGSQENARADGNIRGTYGQARSIRGKKRDFLGLTQEELKAILSKYPSDDEFARKSRTQTILEAAAVSAQIGQG